MAYLVERTINEQGEKQFLAALVSSPSFKNRVPIWRGTGAEFATEKEANAAKIAAAKGEAENAANMLKYAGLHYAPLATRVVAI
jgi:hypothetical protein